MRRIHWLFILLLAGILVFLRYDWRVLGLFKAAMLLNAVTCGWYLKDVFRLSPEKRNYPVLQAIVCILLLMLNGIVFFGVYSLARQGKTPVTVVAEPLPALEWTAFGGAKHTLQESKGRVLALHFWASWCGPCRQEFPELLAFARAHPEITFLAFDVGDQPDKARAFLKSVGLDPDAKSPPNLLLASDPDSEAAQLFRIQTYPSTILVDPQGVMRRRYARPVRWKENWMVSDWHHWAHP